MIEKLTAELCEALKSLSLDERIDALNQVRSKLHEVSPFKNEPVDLVLWKKADTVAPNNYNPNRVAPPEMALLRRSITEDGFTQPIVTCPENAHHPVVDGFHRRHVGASTPALVDRLHGYLPITEIRICEVQDSKKYRANKMASTIRHNRARGTHAIDLMVNIVRELVEAGMSDAWIIKHIGMDADELLRLKQISGLAALFQNKDFSRAWAKDCEDAKNYGAEGNEIGVSTAPIIK